MAHPPTSRGARLRTIDPLAPLTGLVALAVYLLQGFDGLLSRDLAVYSYGGQQFADGVAPFVAILNRAGPLAHAVPGVGAWVADLVGVDDLFGMRVTLMLVAVATIVVMYLLGRDLFGSRGAGLATAAAMLSCEGFIRYATFGPREKTTMVLMLALALLAMVHQRWGTAGAFIALSTLCWQPVAFPAIAGVAVAALLGTGPGARDRLVALARIAVGGLVPTLVTVLALRRDRQAAGVPRRLLLDQPALHPADGPRRQPQWGLAQHVRRLPLQPVDPAARHDRHPRPRGPRRPAGGAAHRPRRGPGRPRRARPGLRALVVQGVQRLAGRVLRAARLHARHRGARGPARTPGPGTRGRGRGRGVGAGRHRACPSPRRGTTATTTSSPSAPTWMP